MTDSMVTRDGKFVAAHVGNVHLSRSADGGLDVSLVAAVTPNASLTRDQVRRLSHVLTVASE
jgi:hypothetical protein